MKFFVISKKITIITDDYNDNEIKNNIHIKNIKKDITANKFNNMKFSVFDENYKLIKKI